MSRPYAEVIGDPVAHSKSPLIHGFWLDKLGIEADYRVCHIQPDELAGYLAQRRGDPAWRGCNVTIPHKQAVMPLLDVIEEGAGRVGAVNTVVRGPGGALIGINTDVDGTADAIAPASLQGEVAVVIGAGGAARAAFAVLADRSCRLVRILARNPDKAARAAMECGLRAETMILADAAMALEGAGLLVNATQLGMAGQEPMPGGLLDALDGMAREALVFDMVYAPLETELLRAARARGLATSDGLVMLVGQAASAFHRFFGAVPPRGADSELRKVLTS